VDCKLFHTNIIDVWTVMVLPRVQLALKQAASSSVQCLCVTFADPAPHSLGVQTTSTDIVQLPVPGSSLGEAQQKAHGHLLSVRLDH
jgi:hypothetical protein